MLKFTLERVGAAPALQQPQRASTLNSNSCRLLRLACRLPAADSVALWSFVFVVIVSFGAVAGAALDVFFVVEQPGLGLGDTSAEVFGVLGLHHHLFDRHLAGFPQAEQA